MPDERFHSTWLSSDRFIPARFLRPVLHFTLVEAAGGLVLLGATVAALIWANLPFTDSYERFWQTRFDVIVGPFTLYETLRGLVNDGLMALFFFVVGLEIKRELVHGELRDPKTAVLPVVAAVGGMVVPAATILPPGRSRFPVMAMRMATARTAWLEATIWSKALPARMHADPAFP